MRFYKTPWFTRMWYPELIWHIPSSDSIYLTFDDGPHPEATTWVLEELDKVNAKATFFCLGKNLAANTSLIKDIRAKGHTIGNHTFNHLKGWKTFDSDYLEDVRMCDEALKIEGIETNLFRPPYGRIKKSQIRKLQGKRVIMWSHLSWDFDSGLNTSRSIKELEKAKPGSILVFHDTPGTIDRLKLILPEILSHFHSKGMRFEALS